MARAIFVQSESNEADALAAVVVQCPRCEWAASQLRLVACGRCKVLGCDHCIGRGPFQTYSCRACFPASSGSFYPCEVDGSDSTKAPTNVAAASAEETSDDFLGAVYRVKGRIEISETSDEDAGDDGYGDQGAADEDAGDDGYGDQGAAGEDAGDDNGQDGGEVDAVFAAEGFAVLRLSGGGKRPISPFSSDYSSESENPRSQVIAEQAKGSKTAQTASGSKPAQTAGGSKTA